VAKAAQDNRLQLKLRWLGVPDQVALAAAMRSLLSALPAGATIPVGAVEQEATRRIKELNSATVLDSLVSLAFSCIQAPGTSGLVLTPYDKIGLNSTFTHSWNFEKWSLYRDLQAEYAKARAAALSAESILAGQDRRASLLDHAAQDKLGKEVSKLRSYTSTLTTQLDACLSADRTAAKTACALDAKKRPHLEIVPVWPARPNVYLKMSDAVGRALDPLQCAQLLAETQLNIDPVGNRIPFEKSAEILKTRFRSDGPFKIEIWIEGEYLASWKLQVLGRAQGFWGVYPEFDERYPGPDDNVVATPFGEGKQHTLLLANIASGDESAIARSEILRAVDAYRDARLMKDPREKWQFADRLGGGYPNRTDPYGQLRLAVYDKLNAEPWVYRIGWANWFFHGDLATQNGTTRGRYRAGSGRDGFILPVFPVFQGQGA
jgi:hypothetical protein